jgi:glycosyltransferase involved in cell wall biosynthesis
MHLFINASGAKAGGGITYLRNVLPHVAAEPGVRATVLVSPAMRDQFSGSNNIRLLELPESRLGTVGRFLREQSLVPQLIRDCGADVLLSTGNFAILRSPVPQILLSRNALYTSKDFARDLVRRGEFRLWTDTKIRGRLARYSINRADCTVAPSQAFADELECWTGRAVRVVHHGFDRDVFSPDCEPLAPELRRVLERRPGVLRILLVSHYNYYRNFETVFRAIRLIRERVGRDVQLVLTCKLEGSPGGYRTRRAVALVRQLGIERELLQLGAVPYGQLQHLYRSSDIYVTAAYAETFAHPLVEAMSCGLPIVASDLPVHREICREAAVYFPPFSPQELADRFAQVALSPTARETFGHCGFLRTNNFSWRRHVEEILEIARELTGVTVEVPAFGARNARVAQR